MHAAPPKANLLVLRSADIHRAVTFYQQMGLLFDLHSHGDGPAHYASNAYGFVLEIYPQRDPDCDTTNVRIGFSVDDVDLVVSMLRGIGAVIVLEPRDTEWGRRAAAKDFDGHTVELLTPPDRQCEITNQDCGDFESPGP
jgi:predicted enzyme related to lactoylglutathione lyase